jgi:hypothetical protein
MLGCIAVASGTALWGSTIYTTGGSPLLFSTLPANSWHIGTTQTFLNVAESFTPATTLRLGTINLGLIRGAGSGNLVVQIAASSAGQPGSVLETLTTSSFPTSASIVGLTSTLQTTLTAGTTYWVIVSASGTLDLYWQIGAPRGTDFTLSGGGGWNASSGSSRGAVEILSAAATSVPEPSSLAMLGIGLAGVWIWRRKRQPGSGD